MTPEEIAQRQAAALKQEADEDLRTMLGTPEGRRVLWALIQHRAGAFRDCFCKEDTHRTAYLEGRRSIALELVADIQRVSTSDYVHMLGEAARRTERERLEREQAREAKEKAHGG